MIRKFRPLLSLFAINVVAVCSTVTAAQCGEHSSVPVKHIKPTGFIPAQPSTDSKRGQQIFQKGSCIQCHSTGAKGGCLGPVLAGVGGRRTAKFITNRITAGPAEEKEFSEEYGQNELLPHPRLPKAQAKLVVSYLMTLPEPKKGFVVNGHRPISSKPTKPIKPTDPQGTATSSTASIQVGKKVFYSKGCMSCHSIGKVGGQFAVALDDIGSTKGRQYISDRINGAEALTLGTNDEYGEKGTSMPPSNLKPSQISSITDYLMSLSKSK